MSDGTRGIESVDLGPGEYTVVPSEWRHDVGEQAGALTAARQGEDDSTQHRNDVVRSGGEEVVLEIVDDRRGMEGVVDVPGQQFLFRSPAGEPVMAFDREGFWTGRTATLRATDGEPLAAWEQSFPIFGDWTVTAPDGSQVATAVRSWSPEDLSYPAHVLESPSGEEIGEFAVTREGLFYRVDVTLSESALPPEIGLAVAYGVSWATSDL